MPVPVITVDQMRQWEAASWAAGRNEADVIRQAGAAVGRAARRLTRPGDAVLILAGKGNNGADARLATTELAGREVSVMDVADPAKALAEVDAALAARPALVIDGLFGIGLNRPLDAGWVALIDAVNRGRRPVLAVDAPSGLLADTGHPAGAAVRADVTVTLAAPKQGLVTQQASPYVGRLEVAAEIGLLPCPFNGDLQWTLPEDFADFPPPRPVAGHKGSFGHLMLVAGSSGYHGAAVLAARGAAMAMPGLVTLFTTEGAYLPVASQLQSTMVQVWRADSRVPEFADAIGFGPGLAGRDVPDNLRGEMRRAWQTAPFPILADASGLDYVPPEGRLHDFWRVITPHPGEAARMLPSTVEDVQRDRVGTVRELSRRYGNCLVVLKGHQTLIGAARGPVFINSSGNPGLAQGGAGDVLAGFLSGLLVQREFHRDLWGAVRYGVWRHGRAADELSATRAHWTVEDLLAAMAGEDGLPGD